MEESILKKEQNRPEFQKYFLLLPWFFVIVLLIFLLFYDQSAHKFEENEAVAQIVTGATFVFGSISGVLLYKKGFLETKSVALLLIVFGFVLRLGYALKYGYNVNQHDVEGLNSSGHLSYIYSIANGDGLPNTNDWQFSHPPLHHFLSALVVKLSSALGYSNGRAFENIQLLTVMYSSLTMFAGYRLLEALKIKGKILVFCVALFVFHPTFQILAGSINNDILTILLSMYSIVYLLKWCERPSLKYAAICGLFIGLGMMTKVSAALMAVVAAVTVLIKFIVDKELKFGRTLLHALVFLVILLPLGLWHPIRNYILFEQPLGYVAPIPTTSALYTGEISIFERVILPFSTESFGVYVDVWEEYNVWFYTLRNSLFGEYNFGNVGFAGILTFFNLLLILISIAAFIYVIVKIIKTEFKIIPIVILFVVQLAFFVYFNIKYPFGCSMDFRYIVPLLFSGVVFIGCLADKFDSFTTKSAKSLKFAINLCITAFCGFSFLVMV